MNSPRPEVGTSKRPDLPLAVIVGAGGMAMAIARRLGQSNRLLIADLDAAHLSRVEAALKGDGYDVSVMRCDVTSDSDVAAFAAAAGAAGPIGVLAHVVGLSPSMGTYDSVMAVNLPGAARIERAFVKLAQAGTAAIFISSMAAHLLDPSDEVTAIMDDPLAPDFRERLDAALDQELTSSLAYQLSKTALNRMCRRRAVEWGACGARIVSISPGLIATPMGALEFERQPMKYDLLAGTPLRREGTMLEIANVVEFVASDRASFISGTDILVDGGLTGALKTR